MRVVLRLTNNKIFRDCKSRHFWYAYPKKGDVQEDGFKVHAKSAKAPQNTQSNPLILRFLR